MLCAFHVRNYRSLRDVTVELVAAPGAGRLAVFIGPNASGKSSILDAVAFARDLIIDGPQAFRSSSRVSLGDSTELTVSDLRWKGGEAAEPIAFSLRFDGAPAGDSGAVISHRMVLGDGPAVVQERVEVERPGHGVEILLEASARTGARALGPNGRMVPAGYQPLPASLRSCNVPAQFPRLAPLFEAVRTIRSYSLVPGLMRPPARVRPPHRLVPHGEEISASLHAMKNEHPFAFRELSDCLRKHVPEIREIETPVINAGWTHLRILEEGLGAPVSAHLLSDGVLGLIGLATIALQPFPASCVLIEDPDAHLHQGLMPLVADLLRLLSRRTTVLVTTHSPRLVAELDIESVRVVEKSDGATTVRPLPRADSLDEALALMDLGDAWMNGFLGGLPAIGSLREERP